MLQRQNFTAAMQKLHQRLGWTAVWVTMMSVHDQQAAHHIQTVADWFWQLLHMYTTSRSA
jgi:hypothetical protein